jgi:hypothetical protein
MFNSSAPKITFDESRQVLSWLLETVHDRWAEGIARTSGQGFRSVCGGMGSFNDVIICQQNGHQIAAEKEGLANELLSCFGSVCFASAKSSLSANEAVNICGNLSMVLQGVRCLNCGHGGVTLDNLACFHAAMMVRKLLREGVEHRDLFHRVTAYWNSYSPQRETQPLKELLRSSPIEFRDTQGMMRPCPSCGSGDTAIYRWNLKGQRFEPSADNLALRPKKSV